MTPGATLFNGKRQVKVVFPSWAPPIQAEVIESQAVPLALPAGESGEEADDFLPPEVTKHGEAV